MFETIYGNQAVKQCLQNALENQILAHAYIIEGVQGSGKHTLVKEVAAALAPVARERIFDGICPDVKEYTLPADRKTISVDTIRALKEDAYLKPSELSVKIYLLSCAECMTVQAQNALLKILEEPPSSVYIFLLCENSAQLLTTVRSRAATLRMQMFSDAQIDTYLQTIPKAKQLAETNMAKYQRILRMCGGTIGNALAMLSKSGKPGKETRQYELAVQVLQACGNRQVAAISKAVISLPQKREVLSEIFALMLLGLRDLLKRKKGVEMQDLFFEEDACADLLAQQLSAYTLSELAKTITACQDMIQGNANLYLALTWLLQHLLRTIGVSGYPV